jgi:hypothetical protein
MNTRAGLGSCGSIPSAVVAAVDKVGIPRRGRDFQAGWKSLRLDFSRPRLFHGRSALPFLYRGVPGGER